jgi:hypothetical protein
MLVYYTFQDSKGRTFPDNSPKQIWGVDFLQNVKIGKMKEILAMWHSLEPSRLAMFNSFRSNMDDKSCLGLFFGNCAKFPLIVTVKEGLKLDASPYTQLPLSPISPEISERPISRVLQHLLTRDNKYKPIVYSI